MRLTPLTGQTTGGVGAGSGKGVSVRDVQRQIDDMTSEQTMLHERLPSSPAFRMMPEGKQQRLLRICQEIGSNCKVT
jgi:hypothetical protein